MVETQAERMYTWEDMQIGHDAPPISVEVTRDSIADYARRTQDTNPMYFDDQAAQAEGFEGIIAPPSMVYRLASSRRVEIMHLRGFIAPEESKINPRPTPFAGTEIWFQGVPVRPGDVVTSTARFEHKWESRSGNRFASVRSIGHNQRGEKVADYLYNIIWEYSRGQKSRSGGAPQPGGTPEQTAASGNVLLASTVSFESTQVGDQLPTVQRPITKAIIDQFNGMDMPGHEPGPTSLLHVDEEFAKAGIFVGTVHNGVAGVAYMVQLLQQAFPTRSILDSTFSERAIEPKRPGDTITYSGKVLDKREEDGKRLVDVEVSGINQLGQPVAAAKATIPL